jgi:hypothetical protein
MCLIITHIDDCVLDKISVKKPYEVSHGIYILDVTYDKQPLLLQTPICTVPYSYNIFDSSAFKIDVVTMMKDFTNMMTKIHSHILNKVTRHNATLLKNKEYIDYVKELKEDEHRIRLRNSSTQNIMAFDRNAANINLSSIQSFDKVVCLYQLQRLIIYKDVYMFGTSLCQIKRLNLCVQNVSKCMITSHDTVNHYGGIDLTKYNKMKHLGIPIDAISHKMTMDGLKHDCITYWVEFQTLRLPPLPPPPPPLPPPSQPPTQLQRLSQQNKSVNVNLLKDIMSHNFQLRKVDLKSNSHKEKENPLLKKFKDNYGYEPPSLNDILNARINLKKVEQNQ